MNGGAFAGMFQRVNIRSAWKLLGRAGSFLALGLGLCSMPAHALGSWRRTVPAASSELPLGWLDARQPLTETAWISHYLLENQRVAIDQDAMPTALEPYRHPWMAGLPDWGWFQRGRYGSRTWQPVAELVWNSSACDQGEPLASPGVALARREALEPRRWLRRNPTLVRPAPFMGSYAWLAQVSTPEPEALDISASRKCPAYKTPPRVTLIRMNGEYERLQLLECDGSVSADTLDRLSVLMRPNGVPRPELPLPDSPEALPHGEWVDGVKLAHPRLVWAIQRIAQAFPHRAIHIVSGYRRESHGYHPRGRAIDLFVHGVDTTQLFQFCRSLNDVGCGYYPNNKFVHVDVRAFGSKHPHWVDVAAPGQPSRYVDSWPGLDPEGDEPARVAQNTVD